MFMDWLYCHSRFDEGITVGSSSFNCLLFPDDFLQLASSAQGFQHAFDRFSAAYDQA